MLCYLYPVDFHPSAVIFRCVAVTEESELGSDPFSRTGDEFPVFGLNPVLSIQTVAELGSHVRYITFPFAWLDGHSYKYVRSFVFRLCGRWY